MNILFHSNQLCLRGTSVALFDYAHFNEEILGNKSYIIFDSNSIFNNDDAVRKFTSRFGKKVFSYEDFEDINFVTDSLSIDFCYFTKAGFNDCRLSNKKNGVHSVFQYLDLHGDVYAYISEWLSIKMSGGAIPYVPYMVNLPEPTGNLRKDFDIPSQCFLFGRYGGLDQFDIEFVKHAVVEFVNKRKDVYFLFANTEVFVEHPNIRFCQGFSDIQLKSNFIASCDAMIHARAMGESFGLAICEFLYGNKPVLAWRGGHDENHLSIIKDDSMLYSDKNDLLDKLENIVVSRPLGYRFLVKEFQPESVMKKFHDVFLLGV